jgi:hypothetical protein
MSTGLGGPSRRIDDDEVPTPRPTREGREGDTEPMPVRSKSPIMHWLVQEDLEGRLQVGIVRYGEGLQAFNGRRALRDAYDEVLDQSVYLRQAIFEGEHGIALNGGYTTIDDLTLAITEAVERYIPGLAEKGMAEKMDVWVRGRARAMGWIVDDLRTQGLAPDAVSVSFRAVPAHLATRLSLLVGGDG